MKKLLLLLIIPLFFSCVKIYNDIGVTTNGKDTTIVVRDTVTKVTLVPSKDSAVIAPIVGIITQPTCTVPTGSVVLSGLPKIGNWTLTRFPGGIVTSGSGVSLTLSDIPGGTYNYTVTNSSGRTSPVSANVTISSSPILPATLSISVTQPTCSVSTGSLVLSNLPSDGVWVINPGNISGTGTSKTLSGLISGDYSYTVTNSLGCSSGISSVVTIKTQPATPTAPIVGKITQPTCTVKTGSVVLSGLPTGIWVLTRTPGNVLISGTGSSVTIAGLDPLGAKCQSTTYTFTVTNAAGCTSVSSNNVTITEYH